MCQLDFFRTPLMAASKQGNADVCAFLLKKGADPSLLDVHGKTHILSFSVI